MAFPDFTSYSAPSQPAPIPLPDGDVAALDLSIELGRIIDVAEEEQALRERCMTFERDFEIQGEQHIAGTLAEYEGRL